MSARPTGCLHSRRTLRDSRPRELDVVAATGEQVTIGLLAMRCRAWASWRGATPAARCASSPTARSPARSRHRRGRDAARSRSGPIVLVAGFQGSTPTATSPRSPRRSDTSRLRLPPRFTRRVPDLHRRRRRVQRRIRAIVPEARRWTRSPSRKCSRCEPRLEGAADPLGRVRRQYKVSCGVLSSFEERKHRSRHVITYEEDENRSRRSSPASRSSATRQITLVGVEDGRHRVRDLGTIASATSTST